MHHMWPQHPSWYLLLQELTSKTVWDFMTGLSISLPQSLHQQIMLRFSLYPMGKGREEWGGLRFYQCTCFPAKSQKVKPDQSGVIKEYFHLGVHRIHFYTEKSFTFHNFKPVNQHPICAIHP